MLKNILIVVAMSAVSILAAATEMDARNEAKQVIELQDGSKIYVFQNGNMARQDKDGNAVSTKEGTVLQAKDGSNVIMIGNEVSELDSLLKKGKSAY